MSVLPNVTARSDRTAVSVYSTTLSSGRCILVSGRRPRPGRPSTATLSRLGLVLGRRALTRGCPLTCDWSCQEIKERERGAPNGGELLTPCRSSRLASTRIASRVPGLPRPLLSEVCETRPAAAAIPISDELGTGVPTTTGLRGLRNMQVDDRADHKRRVGTSGRLLAVSARQARRLP